ncbi:MAG: hypothetical protein KBB24_02885 [Bacteroidales bacterium]|jgi:hypothetical protein|nr:hypothetical protein [Bacteroidales bacterium]HOC47583.1 hypothetical protein [Bacteroidales bacterium]
MKKNAILLVGLSALLTLFSCSKNNDPVNSFTFDGDEYLINDLYLIEEVFNKGASNEMHVFQFMFGNIENGDTTMLALAVLDKNVKTLSGNYPSLGYTEDDDRCLYPFALFFISGISFDGDSYYLTGDGGSVDVTVNPDGLYSVKFNDISVGDYELMGDNTTYTEKGKITGSYEGAIHKEVEEVGGTTKGSVARTRLNSLLEQVK